ncbi:SDR family oxidoreductase [Rubinisphaera margarita]|uniref:SDR family oxidoreductase n=1 Tax=Rubinisphaera margarita TaxID=2909586 RepID=UPI001EE9A49F|nr:SDR family oxidoreductase [Rubinisphaera margarita]MCG6155400.1 SDR family oxidoreductase [Rubinisphaera margarita]
MHDSEFKAEVDRLIVGCGYLGSRVAAAWQQEGLSVAATTRSPAKASEFVAKGILPIVCDVLDPKTLSWLPPAKAVLHAVGYDRQSDQSMREVYVEGLRNLVAALPEQSRLIHISSSSVYGQTDGETVDETSACEPARENGQICLEAEQLLNERANTVILRLAGIYGPERLLARAEQLEQKTPFAGNPDAWLNLIHVEDAVQAVIGAARRELPHSLYLVSDNEPVTRRAYYTRLAELLNTAAPVFDAAADDPKGDRGLNKRCSNQRLQAELVPELRFPTIEQGLVDALQLEV